MRVFAGESGASLSTHVGLFCKRYLITCFSTHIGLFWKRHLISLSTSIGLCCKSHIFRNHQHSHMSLLLKEPCNNRALSHTKKGSCVCSATVAATRSFWVAESLCRWACPYRPVAACCSVLQCVTVCCSVLQCVAVCVWGYWPREAFESWSNVSLCISISSCCSVL